MSNTRPEENSSPQSQIQTYEQLKKTTQIISAGILGGIAKSSILYVPHKFSFYINTAEHKATWTEAAKSFQSQGPKFFYGLDAAIAYSSINYIVFFGFQINLRQALTEKYPETNAPAINSLAATAASVFTTFAVSPLAIWKQKRMLTCASHKELWNEFWMPPISKAWRGSPAKVMTDALNTGVIYTTLDLLNQFDRSFRSKFDYSLITPTIGGAIAGFVGSLASNPFAVIVNKQRETYESFFKTMTRIFQTKGLYGFYPKFLGISAINGICGGIIFNHLKCYFDKMHLAAFPATAPVNVKIEEIKNIKDEKAVSNHRSIEYHHFDSLNHVTKKTIAKKQKVKKNGLFTLFHSSNISLLKKPETKETTISLKKKSA